MSELRPGSAVCECASCGERFSTERNFDRHRVGRFEPDERRCVDPATVGLSRNQRGVWVQPGPRVPFVGAAVRRGGPEEGNG